MQTVGDNRRKIRLQSEFISGRARAGTILIDLTLDGEHDEADLKRAFATGSWVIVLEDEPD